MSADAPNCELRIPRPSLVVLVGASGSGKSTLARSHFRATEIVSSDACRAFVRDDWGDHAASAEAFELLRFITRKRLEAGDCTVVDATNVREENRTPLVTLARKHGAPALAIVLDLPLATILERNAMRATGRVPSRAVREQVADLQEGLARLRREEGFRDVHVLSSPKDVAAVTVQWE